MGKKKGIAKFFGKVGKTIGKVAQVLPGPIGQIAGIASSLKKKKGGDVIFADTPAYEPPGGGKVALPALGTALLSIGKSVAPALSRGITSAVGVRRRRRKSNLTLSEMGKIMVMGQALGKRSPAVTLMTMKAIGGRL